MNEYNLYTENRGRVGHIVGANLHCQRGSFCGGSKVPSVEAKFGRQDQPSLDQKYGF